MTTNLITVNACGAFFLVSRKDFTHSSDPLLLFNFGTFFFVLGIETERLLGLIGLTQKLTKL